jgi:nitroreductase
MELWTAMQKRRSVRTFSPMAPGDRDIEKVLDAARSAPSAGGLDSRQFFVVKGGSRKEELGKACMGQEFVGKAPFVIVFCADLDRIAPYGDRGRDLYCIQDVAASVENALLRMVDLGLAGCWIGAFDEEKVRSVLGLNKNLRPVAIVPIGYEG